MLTIHRLAELAGLRVQTITRWQAAGLLPAPVLGKAASGRGRTGYWPDASLAVVKQIQGFQARGLTLNQIRAQLAGARITVGAITPAVADILRLFDTTQLPFAKVPPRPATVSVRQFIRQRLLSAFTLMVGVKRPEPIPGEVTTPKLEAMLDLAVDDQRLGWALFLAREGYMPCLVCRNYRDVFVTVDFMLGHEFGRTGVELAYREAEASGRDEDKEWQWQVGIESAIIQPLYEILADACREIGRPLPTTGPLVSAAPAVEVLQIRSDGLAADAAIRKEFSIVPIAWGPYGSMAFSLVDGADIVVATDPLAMRPAAAPTTPAASPRTPVPPKHTPRKRGKTTKTAHRKKG